MLGNVWYMVFDTWYEHKDPNILSRMHAGRRDSYLLSHGRIGSALVEPKLTEVRLACLPPPDHLANMPELIKWPSVHHLAHGMQYRQVSLPVPVEGGILRYAQLQTMLRQL